MRIGGAGGLTDASRDGPITSSSFVRRCLSRRLPRPSPSVAQSSVQAWLVCFSLLARKMLTGSRDHVRRAEIDAAVGDLRGLRARGCGLVLGSNPADSDCAGGSPHIRARAGRVAAPACDWPRACRLPHRIADVRAARRRSLGARESGDGARGRPSALSRQHRPEGCRSPPHGQGRVGRKSTEDAR